MRIAIIGAGPAGLYAAYLLKRSRPGLQIDVFEQNPAGATFGFGVVFSDTALSFLGEDDTETHAAILPWMERWSDIAVVHRGEKVVIDGVGFAAIGRLKLLQLLQARAASVGVVPAHETRIERVSDLGPADLVIGADGLNSIVRGEAPEEFGETVSYLRNRFAWYGTGQPFDTLTQTFLETDDGTFNAHHYRYEPARSTFIVECDPETFARVGLEAMDASGQRRYCETLFAETLGGNNLIANRSEWRWFPKLWCTHWHAGNRVLVGDALHTAHYSIGSGTRLALEDVIALVRTLEGADFDIAAALPAYQATREPVVRKLVDGANTSAAWYEDFPAHMGLEPLAFAFSYIQRSGRILQDRLRTIAPRFAARVEGKG